MCERRPPFAARIALLAAALVVAARAGATQATTRGPASTATSATTAAASTGELAEVRSRIAALRERSQATRDTLESMRATERQDSVEVHDIVVRFPAAGLDAGALEQLGLGVAEARAALRARFGDAAAPLLAGERWVVTPLAGWRLARGVDLQFLQAGQPVGRVSLQFPLRAGDVRDAALDRAGARLVGGLPALQAFSGGVHLAPDPDAAPRARLLLVGSRSSVARRCGAGALGACRTIFDDRARDAWHEPADSMPPGSDAVPGMVRQSLVQHAIEVGGGAAVARLQRPDAGTGPDSADVVALLARAAGVTGDSLLAGWLASLGAASASRAEPPVSGLAMTVLWCGVMVGVAMGRRARP